MRGAREIPDLEGLARRYLQGEPVVVLAPDAGVSPHMLRRRFIALGIMRGRKEAMQHSSVLGRLANRRTRRGVPQPLGARAKQSATMKAKADATARGWRVTSHGYVEYTRGEHAGRSFHVVAMEQRIGRRIRPDEIVHHIDGDRQNNDESNLALMTRAAHTRLHRFEDQLAGKSRPRDALGRFGGK